MARSKKDFSKEAMYKKIMPSILISDDNEEEIEENNISKAENVNIFADKINILDKKDLSQLLTEDDEASKTLKSNKFIKMDMSDKLFKKTQAVDEAFDKIEKAMLSKDSYETVENPETDFGDALESEEKITSHEELLKAETFENKTTFETIPLRDDLVDNDSINNNVEHKSSIDESEKNKPYTKEEGQALLEKLRYFNENKVWDIIEEEETENETVERKAYKDLLYEKGYISINPLRHLMKKKLKFALSKFRVEDEKIFIQRFMKDMLEKYPCEEINGVEKEVMEIVKNYEKDCQIDFTSEIIKAIILYRKRNK